MKRFFALSIFIILLCYGCSQADEIYDKEILFRNAKWGSDFYAVEKCLPEEIKSLCELNILDYWDHAETMMTEIGMDYFDAQIGCYCFPIGLDERIRVAGYEVKYLYLYFVFLPGEDGILIKDAEHTAFCFAEYVFEPSDRDAAYVDLVAKLTSIYGDVDVYKIEKPFKTESAANLMYVETNLWYGAEDTMVSVVRMDHQEVDYHKIKIKYGFMGADGLAENAYAAAMKEEKENAVSNIDGL